MTEMLYFLADEHDRVRLATTGSIEAANDCKPWYFTTPEAAYAHPTAATLLVHAVPAAETIPGAPKGTDINDAVRADDVVSAIAHADMAYRFAEIGAAE
jgi:hypothetical protein